MSAPVETSHKTKTHLPGEAGVWVFILGDMLIFALLFIVFIYYRALNVPLFAES